MTELAERLIYTPFKLVRVAKDDRPTREHVMQDMGLSVQSCEGWTYMRSYHRARSVTLVLLSPRLRNLGYELHGRDDRKRKRLICEAAQQS